MKKFLKNTLFPVLMFLLVSIGGYWLSSSAFQSLKEMRQLERVPASKVGALLPGEANVNARAVVYQRTVNSTHTRTPSLYYRYRKEVEDRDSDGNRRWRTLDERTESVDFYIQDETGRALVKRDAINLEWSLPQSYQQVRGDYRYTEWRIEPGDRLFVFGWANIYAGEIEINFVQRGQYTPIISKYGEAEERSDMGASSILKIWLGIALVTMSVYFFAYVFRIHRLVAYLTILTLVLAMMLIDMGLVMMHSDLVSGHKRYQQHYAEAEQRISALLRRNDITFTGWQFLDTDRIADAKDRKNIAEIRLNLLMAREQLVQDMRSVPEKWLIGLWSLEAPQKIVVPASVEQELQQRMQRYWPSQLGHVLPVVFSLLALVAAVATVWYGVRQVKLKRYIENVPTSSTAGAVFGVCEVKGQLVIDETRDALRSPLTHNDCCWYHYKEEERRGSGKSAKWVTIKEVSSSIPCYCQDTDGRIEIDTENAEIISEHKTVRRKGSMRYTETRLDVYDVIYVIGYAGLDEETGERLVMQYSSKREPFIISNRSENDVMLEKARKGIFSLNLSFSAVVLIALLSFGMAGGFAATDFLMSALIAPLFMLLVMFILHYNDIVFLRQRVERNWSNINVSLKKRFNLIPNIEQVVKQYLQHETRLLEDITRLRNKYRNSIDSTESIADILAEEKRIKLGVKGLQESYPELKSNELIMKMMDILDSIENEIMFMRAGYNDSVEVYNTRIHSIPDVVFTAALGFKLKPFINI